MLLICWISCVALMNSPESLTTCKFLIVGKNRLKIYCMDASKVVHKRSIFDFNSRISQLQP